LADFLNERRHSARCDKAVADKDFEMRQQQEAHTAALRLSEEDKAHAQRAAYITYQNDRSSHKAMKRAVDHIQNVNEHTSGSGKNYIDTKSRVSE
jgi:hypothetical protein